jgi:hypothetical protein
LALAVWAGAALAYPVLVLRARREGPDAELRARRRVHWLLAVETGAFLALVATGLGAMRVHGWGIGYPRWLALKLGLVAFLLVPLEAIYACAARVFLVRGLRRTEVAPFTRELERGVSMQEMVWALAVPLLGLALPLLLWLSLARPF